MVKEEAVVVKAEAEDLVIKEATIDDTEIILSFIQKLAEYEKLTDECIATVDDLKRTLFSEDRYANVLIGYYKERAVCFALYFFNYSTFLAKPGIYLEDLFVLTEERGKGFGKKMLKHLAKIAVEKGCGRVEWAVLDWNEPAINFYTSLGAKPMNEWTTFRLTGKELSSFAK
jgi:GNAT superfamily N-acetyltransferase